MICWQSGSWLTGGGEWVEVAVGMAEGVGMDGGEGLKSGYERRSEHGGVVGHQIWGHSMLCGHQGHGVCCVTLH